MRYEMLEMLVVNIMNIDHQQYPDVISSLENQHAPCSSSTMGNGNLFLTVIAFNYL
jgi:hypothetical protein